MLLTAFVSLIMLVLASTLIYVVKLIERFSEFT